MQKYYKKRMNIQHSHVLGQICNKIKSLSSTDTVHLLRNNIRSTKQNINITLAFADNSSKNPEVRQTVDTNKNKPKQVKK